MADNPIVHPAAEYLIKQVGPHRDWSFKGDNGQDIPMRTFSVQLDGIADWVDFNVKPDGDPKPQGEKLIETKVEGHVEDTGKFGLRFVKKRGGGGWGGGKGYSAGAAWSAAYEVAASIVQGYYIASGKKPKNFDEYMKKLDAVAPMVKQKVDDRAGSAPATEETKDGETPKTESESGESPAKGVVIEDIDDGELGTW